MRYVISVVAVVVVAFAVVWLDVTKLLGAHSFWTSQVVWIGAPIGAFLGVVMAWLRVRAAWIALGGAVLTGLAFGVAHIGKTRFAASYAEDALAGQMWYFGWIATCAAAAICVVGAAMAVWPARNS